jgi:hypothetical protein
VQPRLKSERLPAHAIVLESSYERMNYAGTGSAPSNNLHLICTRSLRQATHNLFMCMRTVVSRPPPEVSPSSRKRRWERANDASSAGSRPRAARLGEQYIRFINTLDVRPGIRKKPAAYSATVPLSTRLIPSATQGRPRHPARCRPSHEQRLDSEDFSVPHASAAK